MSTPIRRQYLELKQRYPDTILFFRLGDFYETFDDDAKLVAGELQITLTSKPMGKDLRVPLAWIERGAGTWPAFARALHGAVFVDAGAAWQRRLAREHVRVSAGVELSADVVVGYVLPLTVAAGAAWRYDPARASRGPAVFARVGHAF